MSELTIVTAFFDIGRDSWGRMNRGSNKYLEYFRHWASIQNKVIIYTAPQYAEVAFKIREECGRADRTEIVVIDDVFAYDAEMYHRIRHVMENKYAWYFRYRLRVPESWNYNYNYVVSLKPYFVKDAVEAGRAKGMIAWVDFGFDHGGSTFPKSEEFNFLWDYDFSHHIHVGLDRPLDERPIFNIVRNLTTYIRGNIMIAPDDLWLTFQKLYRQAMWSLTSCGLADDDQTLTLMAYREKPEIFKFYSMPTWGGDDESFRRTSPNRDYSEAN